MSSPLTDEELEAIRAENEEPWQNSVHKEFVDRFIATMDALREKLARVDDIREILAMTFEKYTDDEGDEMMRIEIPRALWDALIDNMEPFSRGDMADRKCWPRSVQQEFRDAQKDDSIEALKKEVDSAHLCNDALNKALEDSRSTVSRLAEQVSALKADLEEALDFIQYQEHRPIGAHRDILKKHGRL